MDNYVYETDLSVDPAVREMGSADTEAFAFAAGEAVTDATAELVDYRTRLSAGTLGAVSLASNTATVTVSGLTFGNVYDLVVTFTRADGVSWSRSLVIKCVK